MSVDKLLVIGGLLIKYASSNKVFSIESLYQNQKIIDIALQ